MIPHQRPVIHLRPGPRLVHLHQLLERLIIRYSLKRHLPVHPAIHHVIAHRPLIRSSCPWHPSRLPPRQVCVNKRITLCATSCYKGRPQESSRGVPKSPFHGARRRDPLAGEKGQILLSRYDPVRPRGKFETVGRSREDVELLRCCPMHHKDGRPSRQRQITQEGADRRC